MNTRKKDAELIAPNTPVWIHIKKVKVPAKVIFDGGYQMVCEKEGKNNRYKTVNVHKSHVSLRLEKKSEVKN